MISNEWVTLVTALIIDYSSLITHHSVLIISTSSSSIISLLARRIMILFPNKKTDKALMAQQAITPVIGNAV